LLGALREWGQLMDGLKVYSIEDAGGYLLGHVTHELGTDYIVVDPADGLDGDQVQAFNFKVIALADSLNIPQHGIRRGREAI
jgi:hypothetical protein